MGKGYTGFAYVLVFMLGFYISHPLQHFYLASSAKRNAPIFMQP
jgi:hypothetical protein